MTKARTRPRATKWDGIEEWNTPLPRWWLWTFYDPNRCGDRLYGFFTRVPTRDRYTRGCSATPIEPQVATETRRSAEGARGEGRSDFSE